MPFSTKMSYIVPLIQDLLIQGKKVYRLLQTLSGIFFPSHQINAELTIDIMHYFVENIGQVSTHVSMFS